MRCWFAHVTLTHRQSFGSSLTDDGVLVIPVLGADVRGRQATGFYRGLRRARSSYEDYGQGFGVCSSGPLQLLYTFRHWGALHSHVNGICP